MYLVAVKRVMEIGTETYKQTKTHIQGGRDADGQTCTAWRHIDKQRDNLTNRQTEAQGDTETETEI